MFAYLNLLYAVQDSGTPTPPDTHGDVTREATSGTTSGWPAFPAAKPQVISAPFPAKLNIDRRNLSDNNSR